MIRIGRFIKLKWIFALFLLCIAMPGSALAQDGNRAGLVVVHDNGHRVNQCVSFSESEISGLQLLERSELDLNYDAGNPMGAAICRIDEEGCSYPQQDCFCQCLEPPCFYWSYWYRSDGDWIYSSVGASSRKVRNGDVQAWIWSEGTLNTDADRRPPDDAVFDTICLPPTATPTITPTATETSIPTVESATATPTMTATPTNTPTSEPTPTGTTTPTATPTGIVLPLINQFGADRTVIDFGETATLFWDVSGADSVILYTADGQEQLPAQGNKSVSPERNTAYSLVAQNAGGSTGAEVVINVNPVFWTPTPVDSAAAPTPLPVATETPTAVPTEPPPPTPTPSETPTEIPTAVPTEVPTDTPIPTDTPLPTSTATATPLPQAVSGSDGQVIVIATPASNQGDPLQRLMLFGGFFFVIGVPLLFAGIWFLVYSLWKQK